MPRGGYRGGGRPSPFQNQPTRTIRVPAVLADEILKYAKCLDRGDMSPISQIQDNQRLVREILNDGLTLKSNAGGAIKHKIREALSLL